MNKKNFVLVVGVPVGRLEIAIDVLKKSTSGKVEFLQDSMLNMPTTAGPGIPVRVGGRRDCALTVGEANCRKVGSPADGRTDCAPANGKATC